MSQHLITASPPPLNTLNGIKSRFTLGGIQAQQYTTAEIDDRYKGGLIGTREV